MLQIPGLFVAQSEIGGRGVFAGLPISKGDTIEIAPVLVLPKEELSIIHRTSLHDYYFLWGEKLDQCVIALGFGSLYNHAVSPNANFILDFDEKTIVFEAIKDIEAGQEVLVNYHGEPGNKDPLWFKL